MEYVLGSESNDSSGRITARADGRTKAGVCVANLATSGAVPQLEGGDGSRRIGEPRTCGPFDFEIRNGVELVASSSESKVISVEAVEVVLLRVISEGTVILDKYTMLDLKKRKASATHSLELRTGREDIHLPSVFPV